MSWIGTTKPKPAAQKPESAKAPRSLEFPTTVSTRGIAPANCVVEHLTAAECRFRTVVLFEHGEVVEFPFTSISGERVTARGTVVGRSASGARFTYRVRLDRMSAQEVDNLARTMSENYRRQAQARNNEDAIANLPTTERLTRSTVRVVSQFPIVYRTPKEDFRPARAGDVSAGGMLMICSEALVEGEPVELRFTLPSEILAVYPEETLALDLKKGVAKSLRPDQRRPFEEMVVGARVVNHRPLGNKTYAYGLAFTCIDGFQHEELA
ncbi:MAG: hypothetical protein JOY98_13910, partial [Candidatus Eremiobacteraeota bacterium]|nr:hypothetical protein [Candidatus Eremiobacteraeota bacterium]